MILFDIAEALARIAVQKSATAANPARTANPWSLIPPEPERISKTSGISEAGEFCAAEHSELPIPIPAPAVDNPEHCACGSPSWWRCAYCEPRPAGVAGTTLTLASGQWRAGTAPPERAPVTAAAHGEIVECCCTADVLAEADDDDLLDADALAGFARALVADRRIRPLSPATLPPLARLAVEIGDDPADLREFLDRTGPGRALRARIEREAGACDRCLLALRADHDTGLLVTLARALDGASVTADAPRPDDGRVQVPGGAWRTPEQHEAFHAFDAHHWTCLQCRRADRCPEGERLHALTRN